ncbi:hypothetical protein ACQRCG_05105 [Bacillus altitudinis]|uniref:hypothetical protein n=1 Tax=Bacillus altitudinis TaxID=293387 RepID=UPI003CFE8A96
MTEEKRTIHVLKDEKLGVDREYVAVDRKAEVGEKIYTLVACGGGYYVKGEYGVVHSSDEISALAKFESNYLNDYWFINNEKYHVLEPTDIVHIGGERYLLDDRTAEVGEKVMYVNNKNGESDGVVAEVSDVGDSSVDVIAYEDYDGETVCGFSHGAYRVLTPIHDAAEPKESDVITVLANLGAEVAELKRAVVRHQAEINALHEDKVRLGEQLAKVVAADEPKALSLTAEELAQIIVSLERIGR